MQRLADDLADRHARIERGERVLEDHLDLAAQLLQGVRAGLGQVLALEQRPPRGRLLQPQDQPPDGGLAATRFADEPQGLAGLDGEIDIVHGPHDGRRLAEDDGAARHGKVLGEP
jgi:hypothetical protein